MAAQFPSLGSKDYYARSWKSRVRGSGMLQCSKECRKVRGAGDSGPPVETHDRPQHMTRSSEFESDEDPRTHGIERAEIAEFGKTGREGLGGVKKQMPQGFRVWTSR